MSFTKWLAVLLLCAPSFGAISANATGACGGISGTSFTITLSPSSGSTVIVGVGIRTTTATVSSITDNGSGGGSTYSAYVTRNDGTNERVELWATSSAAASVTTITVNLSGTTKAEGCANYYTGVSAIGSIFDMVGSSTLTQSGIVIQDANNYVVCVASGAGSATFTASVGTKRASGAGGGGSGSTQAGAYIGDNTSASAGAQVRCVGSMSGSQTWASAAVELRVNSPGSSFGTHIRTHLSEAWNSAGAAEISYRKASASNLLIMSICVADALGGGTINAPTDSNGTVFTAVGSTNVSAGGYGATFYVPNSNSGVHTFTTSFGVGKQHSLTVSEYTGVRTSSPIDVTAVNTGTSTSPSSGSASTTNANDLVYGFICNPQGNQLNDLTVGSGYTKFMASAGASTTADDSYVESKVVSSTGSYVADGTLGISNPWIAIMTTWKDPAPVTCVPSLTLLGVSAC